MNMNTHDNQVCAESDPSVGSEQNHVPVCTDPNVGSHVPDYIVDRLSEAKAQAVEDHMLECVHCHERYLTVIRQVAALRDKLVVGNGHFEHAEEIAAALDLEEAPHR